MDPNSNQIKQLDRYLSPIDVWGMAFGCMVGWGVFAMPGNTFLPVAGPAGTAISMLIGMAVMLVIARNFSYLMGRTSITGGVYSYTKEAFGRDHAFLSSWFLCLSYLTIVFLNGTALFFVVRILFSSAARTGFHYTIAGNTIYMGETVVSVLVLAGTGVLFVAAKPFLQKLLTILAVILFAGILVTAVFCLPDAVRNGALTSFGTSAVSREYAVFSLVILAPWAYVGFEITCFDTAHFKFPIKKSWRILFIAIIAAAFAYIAMALVSVSSRPDGFSSWQEYITALGTLNGVSSVPTFYAAHSIMGTAGLAVMTVTAVAAILTGIIGGYRASTRVLSTMAEDRILSEKFSETTYSILFIMVLSIFLSLLGRNTLNWFVDLTSFGAIVGFGYTSAAAYKIAMAEGKREIMITGMAGTLISVLFAIVQLVPRLSAMEAMGSEAFLLLSFWCLLGFVFYWRTVTRSSLTEYSGMSTSGVVLFALLVYSALLWMAKRLAAGGSMEEVRNSLAYGGVILLIIIFVGLAVMLYVQNVVRKKHEAVEREKIHAVESSLAKSQFLFNMSHDIRTPMNAIIGYTNLARKENDLTKVHDYLDKIDSSGQHLLALINDVLEMSRIENGRIELEYIPSDLPAVFDGIYDLFSEQMRQKNMDFQVHTGQIRNRYVWCDRKNLNRVLLNVISNAFKFTPEGGRISVSLWQAGTEENGYGSYEIRVQDTGIGMSKEFADKMFDAFERERTSTVSGIEGTGLGMSITKSIVDLMGGTIEVLTAPGSGTEIIIRLKMRLAEESDIVDQANEEEETDSTDTAEKEIDFTKKRLLIVEDNMINMEIANMILTQAGFMTETAENGKIAADMVAASAPGYYDAILMDIQMPVMDGYEATRIIRNLPDRQLAGIPILAMTANAFKEDVEAAEKAGMQGHIAKPVDVGILMKTLTEVLWEAEKAGKTDHNR
ncbi:MAG: amino acid permease [Lachnospiraceae bacterium]|nr:amino acid permease [Lachnospiraceae bacterium]